MHTAMRYENGLELSDRMNLLALLPCPLKVPIQEAWSTYVTKNEDKLGGVRYLIESNANNHILFQQQVEQNISIEEMADIIIAPGVNSFYYKHFVDNFVRKGYFVDAADYMPGKYLREAGIKDPGGNYTIFSMNLLVMVADKRQLGSSAMPKLWGDLLEPEFAGRVAIRGQSDRYFCETTLLTFYKQFGMEGIRKLAKAVKYGWHPSQMAKAAGSGDQSAPAVSVMPYFFAKSIKNKEQVEIIWPHDGAIFSPVTMMVKASAAQKLKPVTDFFLSPEVGRIFADVSFPSMHPAVKNDIPDDAPYNWIGWDFIRSNDVGSLIEDLTKEFIQHRAISIV